MTRALCGGWVCCGLFLAARQGSGRLTGWFMLRPAGAAFLQPSVQARAGRRSSCHLILRYCSGCDHFLELVCRCNSFRFMMPDSDRKNQGGRVGPPGRLAARFAMGDRTCRIRPGAAPFCTNQPTRHNQGTPTAPSALELFYTLILRRRESSLTHEVSHRWELGQLSPHPGLVSKYPRVARLFPSTFVRTFKHAPRSRLELPA
jgi:hypothetical protein